MSSRKKLSITIADDVHQRILKGSDKLKWTISEFVERACRVAFDDEFSQQYKELIKKSLS